MAHNTKLTPMNAQRSHDGYYGPAYGDRLTNNYGSGQRGYSPARGHDDGRRPAPPEGSYNSQVQYPEHDQNLWSPQEQYSNGYRGYNPSQRDWQNGRSYQEPSHQKLRTTSPRNGNEHRDRRPRPFPGSQMQGEDYDQRYDNYNSWSDNDHQRREGPQSCYPESQDYQHNGTGSDVRQRPATTVSNPRPPRNDSNLKYGSEEDQLPRYLNHGDRQDPSQSRRGTDGGPQHRHNDVSRSPKLPPSSHARPIDPRSASSSPSRPKRILEDLNSPETLSWDNPFPTFPPKSKQSHQGNSNSVNSSTPPTSLDAPRSQSKSHDSRPQTASSKNSLNSFHNHKAPMNHAESSRHLNSAPRASGDSARSPVHRLDGHSDGDLQVFPQPYIAHESAYDRPVSRDKAHDYGRAVQTVHRAVDIRPEVKAPSSGAPGPGYQRSQTMPAALSDIAPDSGLIPADEPPWLEPGAVSGYYGPQDKGYLPHNPNSGFQSRPQGPSRTYSEEGRWEGRSAARPTQASQASQPRIHEERHAEFFDIHQEPQSVDLPHRKLSDRFGRGVSNDEEMPNFEGLHNTRQTDQQSSIDNHLQTWGTSHRPPPVPANSDPYTQHHFNSGTSVGRQLPRSRSQPDFNEYGPSQGQQEHGFNFGLSSATDGRPATSANADVHAEFSTRAPNRRPQYTPRLPDPYSRSRSEQDRVGPILGPGYRGDERYRGSEPRHMASRAPHPSDPRSRPTQNGGHPDIRPRQPRGTATPQNPGAPVSSPDKPLPNPNALPHHPNPNSLPHHPAPVRQGSEPRSNQAPRPPPVRQYNSPPTDPVQLSTSSRSDDGGQTGSVTLKELETLRQKTVKNPNDSPSQFWLAKKLVEASEVLVDQRADPATRKRNHDKYQADALKIVRKLSALSYPEADFYYADCYSRGALGLQNDIKEAFILYQKAAKANHAQAAYRVAVCCELGQEEGGGTKRDPVKAMQWYKRAATLGDVAAMYKLGVIQLKGLLGQPRDIREAMSWLKKAADRADKENPHALHELALLHEKPIAIDGVQQDEAASRRYFTQAANLGYKFSQFRLGCAYEYGLLGCNVDPRQSIAWYSKAAVQEEHQSELALSGWYLTGTEGVLQQSDTEAYLWARRAAQAGLAKAEYAMGYFTEVGIGAPANLEDAKRWYWKSASQNFPKARDRLEDLRRGGGARQKTRVSRSNMKKQSDGECVIM